jgi:hypothetical protein
VGNAHQLINRRVGNAHQLTQQDLVIMRESLNLSRKHILAGGVLLLSFGAMFEPIGKLPTPQNLHLPGDQTISINIAQDWQLHPGDTIAGHKVAGGIGDIAIELQSGFWPLGGATIHAPFSGRVRIDQRQCLYYTAPTLPDQMLRLCGLSSPHLGAVPATQAIGQGRSLQLATLRKQSTGKWAIVEPDKTLIEKLLKAP